MKRILGILIAILFGAVLAAGGIYYMHLKAQPNVDAKGLMERLPEEQWSRAHHLLIFHGRKVCHARRPDCENCFLAELCLYHKNGGAV